MSNAQSDMFDAVVLTLGFESGPLIRAVASHNLRNGARIFVLMPNFKDERADRAFMDLNRICSMMLGNININIKRIIIDLSSIDLAVRRIRELFADLVNSNVAISIVGGMRALCLATFIAYLLTSWQKEPHIEISLEGRGETLKVPPVHKVLDFIITKEKLNVLHFLAKYGPANTGRIATSLDRDRSTIHRHLLWLEEKGLVRRTGREFEVTKLGMLLA
ncbi:MAG: CRISPR-associated CARF protein Csa3 [archaeon GB-1867-005]|nr:CRISPR-associated CARF protein Csa3 [Candidatus Culexmicrobium cathedralense]